MQGMQLDLRLEDPVIFSERTATEGGHRTLDYIPGAALLGAAAARLYPALDRESAFLLFHSGKVRFHNGLPRSPSGEAARPVPFAWHEGKAYPAIGPGGDRFDGGRLFNLAHGSFPRDEWGQPSQVRSGYVDRAGFRVMPSRALQMKTAISPARNQAAEGQLFGYEALEAGQTFRAAVEADDDVPGESLEQVREALEGTLLLGRSRSAEFGRVSCQVSELPPRSMDFPAGQLEVTLWLASDLAAVDAWGQPTYRPDPRDLGLGEGRLVPEKSFVRTRRYAPFNAARKHREPERAVLTQGSVLTFELPEGLQPGMLEKGLGLFREAGLGQAVAGSPLLEGTHPQFLPEEPAAATGPLSTEQAPDHPVVHWLWERSRHRRQTEELQRRAEEEAARLRRAYQRAREFRALDPKSPVGPSSNQWGRVLEHARTGTDWEAVRGALLDGDSAVCKAQSVGWQDQVPREDGSAVITFREWMRDLLDGMKDGTESQQSIELLRRFARQAMAVAQEEVGQ
jgi:hypothetical protein